MPELRVRLGEEPEDDEDRHHGGHEVGVGDLPRPAVVGGAHRPLLPDDDAGLVHLHRLPHLEAHHRQAVALLSARHASSVSAEVGRSSGKIALGANSTATIGAEPRTESRSPSLLQRRYLAFATPRSSALVAIGWKRP